MSDPAPDRAPSHALERILTRQLVSTLTTPAFLVDPAGDLLYYNEPAEAILGRRFSETGRMRASEWSRTFQPCSEGGAPLDPARLPLMITLTERRPAHGEMWITGHDGVCRHIEVTAVPLMGIGDRFTGAVAWFWELHP